MRHLERTKIVQPDKPYNGIHLLKKDGLPSLSLARNSRIEITTIREELVGVAAHRQEPYLMARRRSRYLKIHKEPQDPSKF